MKELADQMKDAMANLKAQHGLTEDQANIAISQAIAPLVEQIKAIQATELSDQDKVAKIDAAVQVVADTFAPQPAEEPANPAPDADATPAA